MNVISNNSQLTNQLDEIYPSTTYTDYSRNLNFPITLFPDKIVNDISDIHFNDGLHYGGGVYGGGVYGNKWIGKSTDLFKILTQSYNKKLLNRLDMRKIIKYYEKNTNKK
jgi:hypothetical protein